MKIRDFIKQDIDIDVYDDYTSELNIAFVGPQALTPEGEKYFADVLDYDIDYTPNDEWATVHIYGEDGWWDQKLARAEFFFESAAGYCSEKEYNEWFVTE